MASAHFMSDDLGSAAPSVTVAVVYHSGFGHTRVQAEAVSRGVDSVDGSTARLVSVDEVDDRWDLLDAADAIILGTPTYMAGPSAPFKAFLDATSNRWQEQRWKDKLAAGFTNSAGMNGDKLATLQALSLFAMQHGMVWVGLGLLPGNHTSRGSAEDLNRLAGFLGAMAQSNADEPAEVVPPVADRRTAEHLGARVRRRASLALRSTGGGVGAMNESIVAITDVLANVLRRPVPQRHCRAAGLPSRRGTSLRRLRRSRSGR